MADLEVQPRSPRSSRTVQGLSGDVALLSFDNVAAWPENAQRIAETIGLCDASQLLPEVSGSLGLPVTHLSALFLSPRSPAYSTASGHIFHGGGRCI